MSHGLLINLRQRRVKHEFVSTTLTLDERRRFNVSVKGWREVNEQSRSLREMLVELLHDWGAFLQVSLYREALIHFLGGEPLVLRKINVYDGDTQIGVNEVCLLADDTILAVTALTKSRSAMRSHLQRFLRHTKMNFMQWINLNHHDIEFVTLTNRRTAE
jgi:hypothetical protein